MTSLLSPAPSAQPCDQVAATPYGSPAEPDTKVVALWAELLWAERVRPEQEPFLHRCAQHHVRHYLFSSALGALGKLREGAEQGADADSDSEVLAQAARLSWARRQMCRDLLERAASHVLSSLCSGADSAEHLLQVLRQLAKVDSTLIVHWHTCTVADARCVHAASAPSLPPRGHTCLRATRLTSHQLLHTEWRAFALPLSGRADVRKAARCTAATLRRA